MYRSWAPHDGTTHRGPKHAHDHLVRTRAYRVRTSHSSDLALRLDQSRTVECREEVRIGDRGRGRRTARRHSGEDALGEPLWERGKVGGAAREGVEERTGQLACELLDGGGEGWEVVDAGDVVGFGGGFERGGWD